MDTNRVNYAMQGEQTGPMLSSRALAIVHLAVHCFRQNVRQPVA